MRNPSDAPRRAAAARRHPRAFTSVEMLTAGLILALLLLGLMSMFTTGTVLFAGTSRSAFAEADVTRAARLIESELAQACDYQVSADGTSVQYWLLKRDAGNVAAWPLDKETSSRFTVALMPGSTDRYQINWTDRGTLKSRPVLTNLTASQVFTPLGGAADTTSASGNVVTAALTTEQKYSNGRNLRNAEQRTLIRVTVRNAAAIDGVSQ